MFVAIAQLSTVKGPFAGGIGKPSIMHVGTLAECIDRCDSYIEACKVFRAADKLHVAWVLDTDAREPVYEVELQAPQPEFTRDDIISMMTIKSDE